MDYEPLNVQNPNKALQNLHMYLSRGVLEEVEESTLGRNVLGGLSCRSAQQVTGRSMRRGDPIGMRVTGMVGSCYQLSIGRSGTEKRRRPYDLGRVTNSGLWYEIRWQHVTALHIQDAIIERLEMVEDRENRVDGYQSALNFLAFTNVVVVDCTVDIRKLVEYVKEGKRCNKELYRYTLYSQCFAYGSAIA